MKIIKQNCLKYLINREIISSENNFFLFIETVLSIRIIVLDFGLFLGFPFGNVQSVLIICNGQAPVVPVSQSTVQCVNRIRKSWLTKKKKKTVFLTSSWTEPPILPEKRPEFEREKDIQHLSHHQTFNQTSDLPSLRSHLVKYINVGVSNVCQISPVHLVN